MYWQVWGACAYGIKKKTNKAQATSSIILEPMWMSTTVDNHEHEDRLVLVCNRNN